MSHEPKSQSARKRRRAPRTGNCVCEAYSFPHREFGGDCCGDPRDQDGDVDLRREEQIELRYIHGLDARATNQGLQ